MKPDYRIFCIENKQVYDSIMDASKSLKIDRNGISKALRGIIKDYKGLRFIPFEKLLLRAKKGSNSLLNKFKEKYIERIMKLNDIIINSTLQFDEDKNTTKLLKELVKAQKITQELVISMKHNLE